MLASVAGSVAVGSSIGLSRRMCELDRRREVAYTGTDSRPSMRCTLMWCLCILSTPLSFGLALLNELPCALAAFLTQRDIDPKPHRQFDEAPAEHHAVLEIAAGPL